MGAMLYICYYGNLER